MTISVNFSLKPMAIIDRVMGDILTVAGHFRQGVGCTSLTHPTLLIDGN
ncbi:hypothetical protein [Microcystis aeruginosa]|nr:hypothetical protein [Microcystis aeruginosa]MBE8993661.1 hypothetical protein [Microcystis aeruginosa LEGE 91341]